MLSSVIESEPLVETTGSSSRKSTAGERHLAARALAQRRLPSMVLISPLWASSRNGCASFQAGAVLVEKRWWNTTTLDTISGRARSG